MKKCNKCKPTYLSSIRTTADRSAMKFTDKGWALVWQNNGNLARGLNSLLENQNITNVRFITERDESDDILIIELMRK